MDRVLAISLSFSVAAHLVVGGLASQHEQNNKLTAASNSITIKLNPVSVASNEPQLVQPIEAITQAKPVNSHSQFLANTQTDSSAQQAKTIAKLPTPEEHHPASTSEQSQPTAQTSSDAETQQQIQQGLHRLFNTHFYYPRMAQRRGIEGTVHIGLHISSEGEISGIHLSRGSGMDILDKAALQSAHQITVYPESTRLLQGKELDLVMPVKFQLTNS